LYVDAAFEPGGHSGIGGLLPDKDGKCLGFFSEAAPPELVSAIKRSDQETIIFELEGLALGVSIFKERIAGKRVIVFTDNQAASVPDQMQVCE
jgi:hypothetical protein